MKRFATILILAWFLMPVGSLGQSFQTLWKQVEEAQQKDLPQTAMVQLQKIEDKASREKAYGHLLKASLCYLQLQAEVVPDSLLPAVRRLEQREQSTQDLALKAVYDVVLAKIYQNNNELSDQWEKLRDSYQQKAMAHPEVLAKTKTDGYTPFVIEGKDSKVFGDDLLSVVGMELDAWQWMNDYYRQTGNRSAACLTALNTTHTLEGMDSLIAIYGDMPEACELAIRRYDLMTDDRFTAADKNDWLEQSLRRWGTWKRAYLLRNELTVLKNPYYRMRMDQYVRSTKQSQMLQLYQLRNLQQLTMRVFRTNLNGDTELNPQQQEDYNTMKDGLTELKDLKRTLTFSGHKDYEVFKDSIALASLPQGIYMLEFSTLPQTETTRLLYFVSDLRMLVEPQPDNKLRYVVVDATSGQPVGGAKLQLTFRTVRGQETTHKQLTCNQQGEVVYSYGKQRPSTAFAFTQQDNSSPKVSSFGTYSYYERTYNAEHINLFTDRSIYRPGQTVSVTAIVWKEVSVAEQTAVGNKTMTFTLRDVNYKAIGEQTATTDRFGKCSAVFTLPTGQLNGRYTIQTAGGSIGFQVDEYKRPTFQVTFDDYQQVYQQGDTLQAKGKAQSYAGVPVQNGKVRYTVKRQLAYWWLNYAWYWQRGHSAIGMQEEVVAEGTTTTADDGSFTVSMPMVLPADAAGRAMFYHFVAEAEVTDVAGETHRGSMSLSLGNKKTALTCDMPQQVRSDQRKAVTFQRRNAAGQEIEGTIRYRIDNQKWQQCAANQPADILNGKIKSGKHHLLAICEQDSIDMTFVVFSLDDRKPATETHDWFYVSDSQFPNDGKPVTVQVGASDPQLHIVYSIFAGEQMIESGALEKNAELENRQFRYDEQYGNGLLVTYAWVKNGQAYRHQTFIRRPLPDKKLRLAWKTFRDRLTPGQQEEWQLTVKKPDGSAAEASFMAVLYDKSLDALHKHQWTFNPTVYMPRPSTSWKWRDWGGQEAIGAKDYQLASVTEFVYSRFDNSVIPSYYWPIHHRRSPTIMVRGSKAIVMAASPVEGQVYDTMVMKSAPMTEVAANKQAETADMATGKAEDNTGTQDEEEVQLRENLQETAFCYPALTTQQDGSITLKFTLPESLTTWRFMGIAHTTDLCHGDIDGEVVAQKDIMIQPNVPRFIRMGDEAQLSARIYNMTDHAVSGSATLQLTDPESGKLICESSTPFNTEAGKSGHVTFAIDVDEAQFANFSLLVCKVTATGEGFSDGEQHYLPVLANSEYVTKTIPYTQHLPGVKTIDMAGLFPSGCAQKKLTIEYTNNPVWLMVQSLPVIGQPRELSAIDQAASLYSNTLAKTLLAQSPQAQHVFEQWKRETGNETSLTSQLNKNQELKDLLLTETPWVTDADQESEQRQRLADFFDENGINNRLTTALEKLQALQNADGSFSWYPGMEGSTYMTVAVEEMLARLTVMTGQQDDRQGLQDKAFRYIGEKVVDMVNRMKQQEKKGYRQTFPSFTALRWLYICAIDGRKLTAEVQTANNYLVKLLKKDIKNQSIYEKALTAIILAQRGESKKAATYVKSLKEYSVFTEEMGRYYDTRRATYSWYDYKIPTEVAAMEAIQRITPQDQQTLDEMRRWLLQEKRTQSWDTPISSVNAIYAFLNNQQQTLTSEQPQTVLAIDGQPLNTAKATAGIGYVKTAITHPQGKTFTATKTSEGTSWGAVYAQYLQKTADITASESGITVVREVLTTDNTAAPATLKVGDRIRIRITIHTSRDLDFVQVVDRRAACMEPVNQLSGYQHGCYCSPKDYATHYFFGQLSKGKHQIERDYYIDRAGQYETGTCTVGCAYAPEYRAHTPSVTFTVKE